MATVLVKGVASLVIVFCVLLRFSAATIQIEFKPNIRVNSIRNDNIYLYLILNDSRCICIFLSTK
ncbi:MAG: hypothetical protein ABSE83_07610 [Methanobacterium sp.]